MAAHSSSAFVYWDSPADSGYSVDNLPPEIPRSFAVACNTGSGNQLSWSANSDEDFRYYRIYRGFTPDFTPHWLNMVNWTTATRYTDGEYDGWNVYYKLTAVDYSGNESPPASPGDVTGTIGASTPERDALYQNVPNPFNPYTTISFDLKDETDVSLVVYDLAGKLVRVLASGKLKAQ